ncbi:MAG: hypothetical protein ACTHM1_04075 [Solirubrobacteraceae bacterium]
MTAILIPAEAVLILRAALLGELYAPAEMLCDASQVWDRQKHPEDFLVALGELDRCRAALDVFGWGEPAKQEPVLLDLDTHRQVIVRALQVQLGVEHEYMKEDPEADEVAVRRQNEIAARNAQIIEAFMAAHGLAERA